MDDPVRDDGDFDIGHQLVRRREAVAALWDLSDDVVLIGAGEPVPVPGRGDRTYPFRAHSEYFYLTDRERPGGVLAFLHQRVRNRLYPSGGLPPGQH